MSALEKYGCQEIVKEAFTGKTMERPKFLSLLDQLQEGDTLVVCKLDRFARTAIEGVQTVRELFERGVRVHMAIQDLGGRNEGQKFKSLLVWQILLRYTDENHPLSAKEIVKKLMEDYGLASGVHSVCRDIKELQRLYEEDEDEGFFRGERFKYKIVYDGSGERGYKVVKRPCDLKDLQLLVECVCTSRFITKEQERRLLDALTEQCSEYQADELVRDSYLIDRGKNRNNRLPDYVQIINRAIRNDHKIKFKYTKHTLSNRTEQTPRRGGNDYVLSPFKILVTEGNYYLIAHNGKKIVHYRIDRMRGVAEMPDAPREGHKEFENLYQLGIGN